MAGLLGGIDVREALGLQPTGDLAGRAKIPFGFRVWGLGLGFRVHKRTIERDARRPTSKS